MARVCELSGKRPMVGNNVSHANNRTKRRFLPNLVNVSLLSDTLGQSFKFRVAASTLRSVEHRGGLDSYLAKAKGDQLSLRAKRIKRDIIKKQAASAA
ncbi:MAG: 50S ribosomal protein L28 [Pseudomonadota bacterium]